MDAALSGVTPVMLSVPIATVGGRSTAKASPCATPTLVSGSTGDVGGNSSTAATAPRKLATSLSAPSPPEHNTRPIANHRVGLHAVEDTLRIDNSENTFHFEPSLRVTAVAASCNWRHSSTCAAQLVKAASVSSSAVVKSSLRLGTGRPGSGHGTRAQTLGCSRSPSQRVVGCGSGVAHAESSRHAAREISFNVRIGSF